MESNGLPADPYLTSLSAAVREKGSRPRGLWTQWVYKVMGVNLDPETVMPDGGQWAGKNKVAAPRHECEDDSKSHEEHSTTSGTNSIDRASN